MSENSENQDTGQASSADDLTGRAGLEHEAGYVPMPEADQPEEMTLEEAAEQRAVQGTSEANIVTHVAGVDMPENMSMTLEQGAEALAEAREADKKQAEIDDAERIRKEVDELRGEKSDGDKAKAEAEPTDDAEPDIEKVLSNPKIKAAIESQVAESEHAKQQYSQGLEIIRNFAANQFAAFFPEISTLPLSHWKGALEAMAQTQPERYREAVQKIQHIEQLDTARQNLQRQDEARKQTEFKDYAAKENARFIELTKGIPAKEMAEIEAHVPKMLAEHGADVQQFLEAVSNQTTFPRATAEALLVKAARYDLLMKAPKPVAAKQLPHVQRPGVARSPAERGADVSALAQRFNQSGNIDDAVALHVARSKARR